MATPEELDALIDAAFALDDENHEPVVDEDAPTPKTVLNTSLSSFTSRTAQNKK